MFRQLHPVRVTRPPGDCFVVVVTTPRPLYLTLMKIRPAMLIVLIVRLLPVSVAGQAGRAELFGVIRYASGLSVPGASVQAEDQATMARYSATFDDRGEKAGKSVGIGHPSSYSN